MWLIARNTWTCPSGSHYSDVIMGAMVSQITGLSIVYTTVCSGTDQRKHQRSASLAPVRGIHRRHYVRMAALSIECTWLRTGLYHHEPYYRPRRPVDYVGNQVYDKRVWMLYKNVHVVTNVVLVLHARIFDFEVKSLYTRHVISNTGVLEMVYPVIQCTIKRVNYSR